MVEELIDREHVTGVTDRKIDNLMKKIEKLIEKQMPFFR